SAFHYGVLLYDSVTDDFARHAKIDQQYRHLQWDFYGDGRLNYDFSLMRLETPIGEDDVVKPIPFNRDSDLPNIDDMDSRLSIYGYGKTETGSVANELRQVTMKYISNEECTERFQQNNVNVTIPKDFLCSTKLDDQFDTSTCGGDSGGPVTVMTNRNDSFPDLEEVLVGVISAGIGCSTETFPNGHARISTVATWIEERICQHSRHPSSYDCVTEEEIQSNVSSEAMELKLVVNFDYFPEQTLYAIRSLEDQSLVYAGPEVVADRNTQYNTTIYLSQGDYTFEVYDIKGDGMRIGSDGRSTSLSGGGWKLHMLFFDTTDAQGSGTANRIATKTEHLVASGSGEFGEKQVTQFTIADYNDGVEREENVEESQPQKTRITDRSPAETQDEIGGNFHAANARNSIRGRFGGRQRR
ncbi:MAG: hypothetical protein SGILL_006246, partial [Bacillariaceae sp.]